MSLAAFVAAQQLSGGDPVKTLGHRARWQEGISCLKSRFSKFKNNQPRLDIDAGWRAWFVAKDACDILAVETNHLRRDLDSDEITEATNLPIGRLGRMAVVLP